MVCVHYLTIKKVLFFIIKMYCKWSLLNTFSTYYLSKSLESLVTQRKSESLKSCKLTGFVNH